MADTFIPYTSFDAIPNFHVARVGALLLDPVYRNDSLLSSSVVRRSAQLDQYAQLGAPAQDIPYTNPLADLEPDIASKVTTDRADVHGMTGSTMRVVTNYRSKTWGASDILSTIAGIDMMGEIASKIGRYQIDQRRKHLASILTGVSKVAGAAHTHVAGDVLGIKNILAALQKKGDAKTRFNTILMNSLQHYYLQEAEVGFKSGSETNTEFGRIGSLNIIVTDDMPTTKVAILADGAILEGRANLGEHALGYTKDELLANGWRAQALTAREQYILQPAGVSFVGELTGNGVSPTNADLVNANDWKIVVDDAKALPFTFLDVRETPASAPTA